MVACWTWQRGGREATLWEVANDSCIPVPADGAGAYCRVPFASGTPRVQVMMKRCPHCYSYGVVKHRRRLWRRLARRPHTYSCIDCGATLTLQALAPSPDGAALQPGRDGGSAPCPPPAPRVRIAARRAGTALARHLSPTRVAKRLAWLWQWLRRPPIEVWVAKQIDDDILHLCGIGTPWTEQRRGVVIKALRQGSYHGGVCIGQTGVVLNSRLFEALIPHDALQLEQASCARWQGRSWQISHVPQRCWLHEGRLVAHLGTVNDRAGLVSSEDVSTIRDSVTPGVTPGDPVVFLAGAARGDPLPPIHEVRARRRHTQDAGWREDGSWGRIPRSPEGSDPL